MGWEDSIVLYRSNTEGWRAGRHLPELWQPTLQGPHRAACMGEAQGIPSLCSLDNVAVELLHVLPALLLLPPPRRAW